MLDASKAFDKVDRNRLWIKLFDESINHATIFVLMAYYAECYMIVKKGEELSVRFCTTNGFRQGGVASPTLWSIYQKSLAEAIKATCAGIKILFIMICLVLYADDTSLISDSDEKMQKMLDIAGKEGLMNDIQFNAKKSVVIIVNQP